MSTSVYIKYLMIMYNYTLYRYWTSTTIWQLNTVKQHHTSMVTSIHTNLSTYRSLSAQRLSENTVLVSSEIFSEFGPAVKNYVGV
jgi:hypothetical protein